MNPHDRKVIQKIIEHARHILSYTEHCTDLEAFSSSGMLVEACVFNLMQIGELAHRELSEEAKETATEIPWQQIYGMRNRIVHGYDEVNLLVVWETIADDLKPLVQKLEKML